MPAANLPPGGYFCKLLRSGLLELQYAPRLPGGVEKMQVQIQWVWGGIQESTISDKFPGDAYAAALEATLWVTGLRGLGTGRRDWGGGREATAVCKALAMRLVLGICNQTVLSNLRGPGGSSLSCDLTSLTDLRRIVVSVCSVFHLLVHSGDFQVSHMLDQKPAIPIANCSKVQSSTNKYKNVLECKVRR